MFDPQKYDYFLDLTKEVAVRKCGTRIREIFFSSIRCETRDGKVGDLRELNGISTNSGMSPPWEVVNERSFVLSLLSLSLSLLKKRKICRSMEARMKFVRVAPRDFSIPSTRTRPKQINSSN